jgi:hypothetical protein
MIDKVRDSIAGVRANQRYRALAILPAQYFLFACAALPPAVTEPRLAPDHVLTLAQDAFAACAPVGTAYFPDAPGYVAKWNVWWVHFREAEASIDPHAGFVVVVNDRSERVCVQSAAESGQCP